MYTRLWELLSSRIFNSYIQTTAFVPFAEFVNHDNVASHYDHKLISTKKPGEPYKEEELSSGEDNEIESDEAMISAFDNNEEYNEEYTQLEIEDINKEPYELKESFGDVKEEKRFQCRMIISNRSKV